jgi:hypothetical protein
MATCGRLTPAGGCHMVLRKDDDKVESAALAQMNDRLLWEVSDAIESDNTHGGR